MKHSRISLRQRTLKTNVSLKIGLRVFLWTLVSNLGFFSGSRQTLTYGSDVPDMSIPGRSIASITLTDSWTWQTMSFPLITVTEIRKKYSCSIIINAFSTLTCSINLSVKENRSAWKISALVRSTGNWLIGVSLENVVRRSCVSAYLIMIITVNLYSEFFFVKEPQMRCVC